MLKFQARIYDPSHDYIHLDIWMGKPEEEWTIPSTWSFEELLTHLIYLNCTGLGLSSLPDLPKVETLYCMMNQLSRLPNIPNIKVLHCAENLLTSLPELPQCVTLWCYDNQLRTLPRLPSCKTLGCENNLDLPYVNLDGYNDFMKSRRTPSLQVVN